MGSLTGAVASQKVTEAFKGTLTPDGNRSESIKAEVCLTVRLTSRTDGKPGLNDPVRPSDRRIAHRIKVTPGITG